MRSARVISRHSISAILEINEPMQKIMTRAVLFACYQPPGGRPVARWIYGEDAFSGAGPFVGRPGSHSISRRANVADSVSQTATPA
jgi:hypothetical protein